MNEIEKAVVALFRAIKTTGMKNFGHDRFDWTTDITVRSSPEDKENALKFSAILQEALNRASDMTGSTISVEGTTLQ